MKKELSCLCREMIDLVRDYLLKNAEEVESTIFYKKLFGDYNRYLAEFSSGTTKQQAITAATNSYEDAMKLARQELKVTHPVRVGLALNYTIFLHDEGDDMIKACEVASKIFDETMAQIDDTDMSHYKDTTLNLKLLKDNLLLWNEELREAEAAKKKANERDDEMYFSNR